MDESIKNSVKIEFVDYNGDKHVFYNERLAKGNNQVEFLGNSFLKFLHSLGWNEFTVNDIIETILNEI